MTPQKYLQMANTHPQNSHFPPNPPSQKVKFKILRTKKLVLSYVAAKIQNTPTATLGTYANLPCKLHSYLIWRVLMKPGLRFLFPNVFVVSQGNLYSC